MASAKKLPKRYLHSFETCRRFLHQIKGSLTLFFCQLGCFPFEEKKRKLSAPTWWWDHYVAGPQQRLKGSLRGAKTPYGYQGTMQTCPRLDGDDEELRKHLIKDKEQHLSSCLPSPLPWLAAWANDGLAQNEDQTVRLRTRIRAK